MRDTCRLCQEPSPLVRSHIIPEFIWKRTYGPDGATMSVPPAGARLRVLRKGLRERLLCEGCERILKRYEDYFAQVWFQDHPLPTELPPGIDSARLDGLDYHRFKLFHLSVLWRAHCAEGPEFSEINVGDRHEIRLRKMLYEGEAGADTEYPLSATLILRANSREIAVDLIGAPSASRLEGHRICTTIYAGCAWSVVVSSHESERSLGSNRLLKDGSLFVPALDLRRFPNVYRVLAARREEGRELRRRRLSRG